MELNKIVLFDIAIANVNKLEVLEQITSIIELSQQKPIYFVNANNLKHAYYDSHYKNILKGTEYVFGDGVGVNVAANLLKERFVDNVNGTDLFPLLCEYCTLKKYSLYFLGGKPGIVDQMMKNLKQKYPLLIVSGAHHGYFDRNNENEDIIRDINSSKTNILLVGFGTPLQEEWICDNLSSINCNVAMGVGGLFDFYSGSKLRAPLWLRKLGLEWFFRLLQEPGRLWKRYMLGIPQFILLILKQKFQELYK